MNDFDQRRAQKDSVYMDMAEKISELSRDNNTKIGCMIVAEDGSPVSWGYNGTMAGVNDSSIPHSREDEEVFYLKLEKNDLPKQCSVVTNKYPWMRHAERNAIKYANPDKLKGATLYVNAYPCEACALEIADSGIKQVVVRTTNHIDSNSSIRNDRSLSEAILAQKNMQITVDGVDYTLMPSI